MPSVAVLSLNPALDQTIHLNQLVPGGLHRARHTTLHPGGKGVNVATILAEAGVEVCLLGLLGHGYAPLFQAHFRNKGIRDETLAIPGQTRTSIKLLQDTPPLTTDINLPGIPYDNALTPRLDTRVRESASQYDWLLFCGSLPPGAPPDLYAHLVQCARPGGARIALDTSGAALVAAHKTAPDCIKPNLEEFREWANEPLDTVEALFAAADTWFASGTGTILLSLGAAGAAFLQPERRRFAEALRVPVTSTVGAGDALLAGWVSGALAGEGFEGCVRRAMAYAACAVQQVEAGLPAPDKVEAYAREVVLHTKETWLADVLTAAEVGSGGGS